MRYVGPSFYFALTFLKIKQFPVFLIFKNFLSLHLKEAYIVVLWKAVQTLLNAPGSIESDTEKNVLGNLILFIVNLF